jgi:hypothetical protein
MTHYATQTQLLLGATPFDVPFGRKLKSVTIDISNNVVPGAGGGVTANILPEGAGPSSDVEYGSSNTFTFVNVSWLRVQGNGANVSFSVDSP